MCEGYVFTAEQRENLRKASFLREATIRKKVSVNGRVYPNLTQAAKANNLSARTVARYAASAKHSKVFYL
ncbi:hypothetical protein D3C75_1357610 [compost metagenome]